MNETHVLKNARTMPLDELLKHCKEAEQRNCKEPVIRTLYGIYYERSC